jgi:predicted phage tail protein
MPALDHADLVAILGEDYQAKKEELERLSGQELAQLDAKQKIESLSGQKAPALYGALLGALLIYATKLSPSANAATNQTIFGVGLIVVSLGFYFWIRYKLNQLSAK